MVTTTTAASTALAAMAMQTDEIFAEFTTLSTPYVTREGHEILAHVLIPPPSTGDSSKSHPVIVNFHGGYLISGSGLYAPYFPALLLPYAKKHSAIIVSPDYTLLPHADGLAAIQADVASFHTWLHADFPSYLSANAPAEFAKADLTRVLVHGGSAGGYVAVSYGLAHPEIRALSLTYPMLDFSTEWWRRGSLAVGAPNPLSFPDDIFPEDQSLKEKNEAAIKGPRVTAPGESRPGWGTAIARSGMFHSVFSPDGKLDGDDSVWLERRVARGDKLPQRIWVLHGDADTAVPVDTSVAFADTMKAQGRPVRLDIVAGKEHGWDGSADDTWKGAEDPLILEATEWLAERWLE